MKRVRSIGRLERARGRRDASASEVRRARDGTINFNCANPIVSAVGRSDGRSVGRSVGWSIEPYRSIRVSIDGSMGRAVSIDRWVIDGSMEADIGANERPRPCGGNEDAERTGYEQIRVQP